VPTAPTSPESSWLRRNRRRIIVVLGIVSAVYGFAVVIVAINYRNLLYPGPFYSEPPEKAKDAIPIETRAEDGALVNTLLFDPPAGAPVVVHFHGNGEDVESVGWIAKELRSRGVGVLLVEYRGYGASRREAVVPTEPGLYADAAAALDALAARGIGPDRVVLLGQSLGTAIAAEMALRGRGRALVLISPYTDIVEVMRRHVPPLFPLRLIVSERFDTLSKAPRIAMPTLIIHGDSDEIIPYDMGVRLSKAFPHAELFTEKGLHHNDLMMADPDGVFGRIARFATK
jgi:uncharacterized protein